MYDLTLPWSEDMLSSPQYPTFERERIERFEDAGKRLSAFSAKAHQGTHVDAPAHYIEDGRTIDRIDLDRLVGPAHVADLRDLDGRAIRPEALQSALPSLEPEERVIVTTCALDVDQAYEEYTEEVPYLTAEAAEWLVGEEVSVIAHDCMTEATPGDPSRPVHRTLLGNDVPIVERLFDTGQIAEYETVEFVCLPLLIPGFEAAPARAIARAPESAR